jgi:hypothetical protein
MKKPLEFTWQVVQKRPMINDTEVEQILKQWRELVEKRRRKP